VLERVSLLPGQYFGWEEAQDVVDKLSVEQAFPPTWPIFWMGGGSGGGRQASCWTGFPSYLANILDGRRLKMGRQA
jgi:hypothetical protein